MGKRLLPLWFLGILQLCSVFGEGFEMPSHNPDAVTYFQEVSLSHLRHLSYEKGTTIPFYGSGFLDAINLSNVDNGAMLLDVSAGTYIRMNDYFYIPLSYSITGNFVEKGYDGEILFGTGLVLRTDLITLGLYGGYDIHSYEADRDGDGYGDGDGFENREFTHDFKFTMVPVIKTQKYPVIGYFLESIFGFIGTGQKEFKPESYSINLGFIPFKFGNLKFSELIPYHVDEWYNREAKNKLYGCKLNVISNRLDKLEFMFDAGYRDYYNIQGNQQFYEDTFYLQLGILRHHFVVDGVGLSIILDNQNLFPPGFLITLDMNKRNLVNHDFFIWRFFAGFKSSNGGELSFGLTMTLGGNSKRKKYSNLWWLL
jgi:hypothetical protein